MSTFYREKGVEGAEAFNTLQARVSIDVEDLMASADAEDLIAERFATCFADMVSTWNEHKDSIEPVPDAPEPVEG